MGSTQKEIQVKPGEEKTETITVGDKTFSFTYKCTGGTGEMWNITAEEEGGGISFFVGRSTPPSYLLFTTFSATISGGTLEEVEVWDNSGVVLKGDQYDVQDNVVKPAPGWGGNLALLTVRSA